MITLHDCVLDEIGRDGEPFVVRCACPIGETHTEYAMEES